MIVKILFGEDEEIIINPNCTRGNFFDYLCTTLLEHHDIQLTNNKDCLDLVDVKGRLQKVNALNINQNVGDLLSDRCIYVIVTIKAVDDVVESYTPLLSVTNKYFDKISMALTTAVRRPSKRGTPDHSTDRSRSNLSRAGAISQAKKLGRNMGKK